MTIETQTTNRKNTKAPYSRVKREELVLRDVLAADRTVLANERTFLAYMRTALAFMISGTSLIHFFDMAWAQIVGAVMIPIGAVILIWGIWRYFRVRKDLKFLR